MQENVSAANIELSKEELSEIDSIAPHGIASGERYAPAQMTSLNG